MILTSICVKQSKKFGKFWWTTGTHLQLTNNPYSFRRIHCIRKMTECLKIPHNSIVTELVDHESEIILNLCIYRILSQKLASLRANQKRNFRLLGSRLNRKWRLLPLLILSPPKKCSMSFLDSFFPKLQEKKII